MPIGSAQDMLRQLQQQMSSPTFGSQFMGQLQNAGLGAQNPQNFYGTPLDEQFLRQSVMNRVLGYYGMPMGMSGQYNNIGNPNAVLGGRMNIDPFTGGMQNMPDWAQGGFADKAAWKQAGRPMPQMGGSAGLPTEGGNPMELMPFTGGGQQQGFGGNFPNGSQNMFYDMMQGYNPQVPALNQDYGSEFANALARAQSNYGSGGGSSFNFNIGGFGGGGGLGLPPIDPATQANLDQMYNAQLGSMGLDFDQQKQDMINQLYGRGVNASTIAADTAGRLNYGRQQAINQLFANRAANQIDIQKALLQAQTDRAKSGGGGISTAYFSPSSFSGVGGAYNTGGGSISPMALAQELTAPTRGSNDMALVNQGSRAPEGNPLAMSPMSASGIGTQMNTLGALMGNRSPIPMTFEQQMQLAQLQLQQQQLAQQGQLGFGGLGLQQQLGLGSQGLQGQNLAQDFMSQLLGMGLNRQQGAANFTQNDLARMQQYLQNQSNQFANIGQQNAQLEAQRRSFMSQLMGGLLGGASALLPGLGQIQQAGGFGSFFGGLFGH